MISCSKQDLTKYRDSADSQSQVSDEVGSGEGVGSLPPGETPPKDPKEVIDTDCGTMNPPSCEVFKLVNAIRLDNGLRALGAYSNCTAAAQAHATDMYENGYFSHDSPTETWIQRFRRFGVTGGYMGENIATGSSAESAVSRWMNSSGHRANILNGSYSSTGIGFDSSRWVQCFSSHTVR